MAIAEVGHETKTDAEQLRFVADWLENNECRLCGIYPSSDGVPKVYFITFSEMQRIFAGRTAMKKQDGSRFVYSLTVDGICFQASKWIQERACTEPREEIL